MAGGRGHGRGPNWSGERLPDHPGAGLGQRCNLGEHRRGIPHTGRRRVSRRCTWGSAWGGGGEHHREGAPGPEG